jgi:chemotaxis protein histidine kinase CheA
VNNGDIARLLGLAARYDAQVIDQWGRSTTTVHGSMDIDELAEVANLPHYRVQLLLGNDDRPLSLSGDVPDATEMADLQTFAANERERAELAAAHSPIDVARQLADRVEGAFIEYARLGWARTSAAFIQAANHRWAEVVRDLSAGSAMIGEVAVKTALLRPHNRSEGLPVFTVESATGIPEVDSTLEVLADAAAWTQLAAGSTASTSGEILLALHHDQDPAVAVDLTRVAGGLDLLLWRAKDNDASRDEALRYVLRLVTASSDALPNAKTVQRLAERQYIALTRDRAAEVFRAIADSQRATADLLETSASSFSTLVENTTNNAVATVAGVVGLVALLADKAHILPSWLVAAAAAATVAGVIAVIVTRWRRVDDAMHSSERLLTRLRDDPLLPADELAPLVSAVEGFDFASRAKTTQVTIVGVGAVACIVAILAAGWLVEARGTATTIMTTTTTAPPTTLAHTTAPSSAPPSTLAPPTSP